MGAMYAPSKMSSSLICNNYNGLIIIYAIIVGGGGRSIRNPHLAVPADFKSVPVRLSGSPSIWVVLNYLL